MGSQTSEAQGTRQGRAVKLLRATEEHDPALAEFYRATWNPDATAEIVRQSRRAAAASNPVSPGEESPTFIFLQEGRILGHVGTIPVRVWSHGEEHPAHWVKGFWVLPEYRNGPIGFLVLREALKNLDCAMALTVLPVVVGLSVGLGFSDLGTIPNFIRILHPAKLAYRLRLDELGFGGLPRALRTTISLFQRTGLASIGGLCLGGLTRVAIGMRGRFPGTLTVTLEVPRPSDLDQLWLRTRKTMSAGLVRDARYLTWRYLRKDSGDYRFVTVRKGNDLIALAVVRRPTPDADPRLRGITLAPVSEWIFPLDESVAGLAALAGAEQAARELHADGIICSVSHPGAAPLLRRRGYWRGPPNVHLLIRDPAKSRALPSALSSWWVTRGDSYADGAF